MLKGLLTIFGGNRPDITPAQVLAVVVVLVAVVVFKLSEAEALALGGLVLALLGGDAATRVGRNIKDGKVEAAALSGTDAPHDLILPAPHPREVEIRSHVEGTGFPSVEAEPLTEEEIEALDEEDGALDVSSDPEADAIPDEALPDDDEEGVREGYQKEYRRSPGRLDEDPQA